MGGGEPCMAKFEFFEEGTSVENLKKEHEGYRIPGVFVESEADGNQIDKLFQWPSGEMAD